MSWSSFSSASDCTKQSSLPSSSSSVSPSPSAFKLLQPVYLLISVQIPNMSPTMCEKSNISFPSQTKVSTKHTNVVCRMIDDEVLQSSPQQLAKPVDSQDDF